MTTDTDRIDWLEQHGGLLNTSLKGIVCALLLASCGDAYHPTKEDWEMAQKLCRAEYEKDAQTVYSYGYAGCGGKSRVSWGRSR